MLLLDNVFKKISIMRGVTTKHEFDKKKSKTFSQKKKKN